MTRSSAKALFRESQVIWLIQYEVDHTIRQGVRIWKSRKSYCTGRSFAAACADFVARIPAINGFKFSEFKGTPEEFVRAHAHGATRVGLLSVEAASKALAHRSYSFPLAYSIEGQWPEKDN